MHQLIEGTSIESENITFRVLAVSVLNYRWRRSASDMGIIRNAKSTIKVFNPHLERKRRLSGL